MLTIDNINISYNYKEIVSNFSINIFEKSIIMINGKNGSGKTSLLRILATIDKQSSGSIFYKNNNIYRNIDYYRTNINYISHKKSIKNQLSVIENINFMSKLYSNEELIEVAIDYFNLEKFLNTNIQDLSEGIKQRVELTRLILKPANIWILDEPENNLDHESIKLLHNLIISKAEQNNIVIIASHNKIKMNNTAIINIDDFNYLKSNNYLL